MSEAIGNSDRVSIPEAEAIEFNGVRASAFQHTFRNIDSMIAPPIRSIYVLYPLSIDFDVNIGGG